MRRFYVRMVNNSNEISANISLTRYQQKKKDDEKHLRFGC